ncbi:hypothetical protein CAOG_05579 [Capsaspora owczarzaki ATCC 30864]|uniref:CAP-Gly domain-containing protein n=1 Tax=Capsaspora owczarzaki (strain ATCC 30864) TaxID=595528 RepID=A0A0D2VUP2_CAPO3|nr:hypothetical protein CAOG_05579 [Capsaspora owczarzaki ATCC 30864]KJE95087.1 hypothetical protein CAOG_005579 [Capsaspora owczarzaki ATCC 30864]|eukprot:XP_004346252.1 hypothetical protein CAOG_05579 [Capsaspora owczarzaki ATCC 30864]
MPVISQTEGELRRIADASAADELVARLSALIPHDDDGHDADDSHRATQPDQQQQRGQRRSSIVRLVAQPRQAVPVASSVRFHAAVLAARASQAFIDAFTAPNEVRVQSLLLASSPSSPSTTRPESVETQILRQIRTFLYTDRLLEPKTASKHQERPSSNDLHAVRQVGIHYSMPDLVSAADSLLLSSQAPEPQRCPELVLQVPTWTRQSDASQSFSLIRHIPVQLSPCSTLAASIARLLEARESGAQAPAVPEGNVALALDDGTHILAHQVVLQGAAPYFYSILAGAWSTLPSDSAALRTLALPGIAPEIAVQLVVSMYAGNCSVSAENALALAAAADTFGLHTTVRRVEDFLSKHCHNFHVPCTDQCVSEVINVCNATSEIPACSEMADRCMDWLGLHCDRVWMLRSFMNLKEPLREIVYNKPFMLLAVNSQQDLGDSDFAIDLDKSVAARQGGVSPRVVVSELLRATRGIAANPQVQWAKPSLKALEAVRSACLKRLEDSFCDWVLADQDRHMAMPCLCQLVLDSTQDERSPFVLFAERFMLSTTAKTACRRLLAIHTLAQRLNATQNGLALPEALQRLLAWHIQFAQRNSGWVRRSAEFALIPASLMETIQAGESFIDLDDSASPATPKRNNSQPSATTGRSGSRWEASSGAHPATPIRHSAQVRATSDSHPSPISSRAALTPDHHAASRVSRSTAAADHLSGSHAAPATAPVRRNIPSMAQRVHGGAGLSSAASSPARPSQARDSVQTSLAANQLKSGMRVRLRDARLGTVRYVGNIHVSPGTFVGLELDEPGPKYHDGCINDVRYFDAPKQHGVLVKLANVETVLSES